MSQQPSIAAEVAALKAARRREYDRWLLTKEGSIAELQSELEYLSLSGHLYSARCRAVKQ